MEQFWNQHGPWNIRDAIFKLDIQLDTDMKIVENKKIKANNSEALFSGQCIEKEGPGIGFGRIIAI